MNRSFQKAKLLIGLLGLVSFNLIAKADNQYPQDFINSIDAAGSYFTERWRKEPLLISANIPSPTVISLDKQDKIWSRCTTVDGTGRGDSHHWGSSYCGSTSHLILLEKGQLYKYYSLSGSVAVYFIVAHEFAHAIQEAAGMPYVQPYSELHADCLAGMSLSTAYPLWNGSLEEVRAMADTAYEGGSDEWVPNPSHGSRRQRRYAFLTGLGITEHSCKQKDIELIATLREKDFQRSLATHRNQENTQVSKTNSLTENSFSRLIRDIKTAFLDYLKRSIDPKLLQDLKKFLEI